MCRHYPYSIALIGTSLVVAFLCICALLPLRAINSCQIDIDINSGQVRTTFTILGITVHDAITQSGLARVLDSDANERDWHPVSTTWITKPHSPHYEFHNALAEVEFLEMTWASADFSVPAKRATAAALLESWKSPVENSARARHAESLLELAIEYRSKGRRVNVTDLPPALSGAEKGGGEGGGKGISDNSN